MPDTRPQRQPENEEEEETLQARLLADQITPLVQSAQLTADICHLGIPGSASPQLREAC